jgi:uncharacterized protein with ATP-grasp and redox domains
MEPLKAFPQCVDCLMGLARTASELARGEDSGFRAQAEALAHRLIEENKAKDLTSPAMANLILREVKRLTGVSDPYAHAKIKEMAQAKKVLSQVEKAVGPDLRSLMTLSVLGNSLDFFKNPEESLSDIPEQIRTGVSFYYDDIERLERFLCENPALVLYLTDNAGEIFFDLPLYAYIQKRSRRTVLLVKGGPAINDLTRMELESAHLEERFEEIMDTGTDGVGIDWEHVSPLFLDLVGQADLIVSKGMANFETIYPKDLKPPVFFLFKVKCRPIQDYIQAPAESFLAFWKDGAPPGEVSPS